MRKYALQVITEDGRVEPMVLVAKSDEDAKDLAMSRENVVEARVIKSQPMEDNYWQEQFNSGIDSYVGTDQDAKDMIGL